MNFSQAQEFGAVTSLAISPNQRWLAVGHDSGNIQVWDLIRQVLAYLVPSSEIENLKDNSSHLKNNSVIHVSFLNSHSRIVSGDILVRVFIVLRKVCLCNFTGQILFSWLFSHTHTHTLSLSLSISFPLCLSLVPSYSLSISYFLSWMA